MLPGVAMAQLASDPTMTSNNYSAVETEVGGNGCNNAASDPCGASTSYQIDPSSGNGGSSLGESAVGNSSSSHYQSNSGFNTTAQPGLTMVVNTGSVALGTLSTSVASTAQATFDVTDYTSYGYIVQIIGSTPGYGTHNLANLATDTASSAGTEQFGINVVANTSPVSFGANPYYPPDGVTYPSASKFSYGVPGDGTHNYYTQTGKFRFNSGETIASSPKTSGDTTFTISFLANISNSTNAGKYQGNLALVATGTF